MNPRTLFVASCIALITSAFTFVIRGDIMPDLRVEFDLSQAQVGLISGGAFWGMAVAMLLGAPICDVLGMKRILFLAFGCHMAGVFGTVFAPHGHSAMAVLFGSTFLAGCGNGLVEIAINPLAATLYPTQKTHYLNILHAWWPGGLILGGLIAQGLGYLMAQGYVPLGEGISSWQARMGLIVVPGITYLLLCLPQRFPQTERVSSGVSTAAMFKEALRPMFLIWAFCMLLTASTELGPQQWQESVIRRTSGVSGTLILVYTSSMMFILRHFAGPLVHAFSPVGLLMGSSAVAGIGLYLLSTADSPVTAFGFATIFGLGIAYFWPTMLGVTAERFPKGGALLLGLMGSVGNLAVALVLPFMGYMYDRYTVEAVPESLRAQVVVEDQANRVLRWAGIETVQKVEEATVARLPADQQQQIERAAASGAAMAFRAVSVLPILLILLFGGIALRDWAAGGYKAEMLVPAEVEKELFAGGVQAPVE